MSKGINKVTILGRLGFDPEVRFTQSGSAVANLRVATSESWTDKTSGERKEQTEWHRVVCFGRLAEIAGEYLRKGLRVYVEGKITTREWERDGAKQYTTEIHARELQLIDRADTERAEQAPSQARREEPARAKPTAAPQARRGAPPPAVPDGDFFDDDIPF